MLLLGKTFYRNNTNNNDGGSGNDTFRTPIEVNLGIITIAGDYPTEAELANALNDRPNPITITSSDLYVFKVSYRKQRPT